MGVVGSTVAGIDACPSVIFNVFPPSSTPRPQPRRSTITASGPSRLWSRCRGHDYRVRDVSADCTHECHLIYFSITITNTKSPTPISTIGHGNPEVDAEVDAGVPQAPPDVGCNKALIKAASNAAVEAPAVGQDMRMLFTKVLLAPAVISCCMIPTRVDACVADMLLATASDCIVFQKAVSAKT